MSKKYFLTTDQISEIKRDYHNTLTQVIALKHGCSVSCIYNLAHNLSLKKDHDFIKNTSRERNSNPNHGGIKTRFKKGSTPPNKGKKQIEYMKPQAIEATKAKRFKKGHIPQNHKDVGYERISSKGGYVYIKTAEPNTFRLKHRVIWEQHNGPIPRGYNVQFKDRNRQNTNINNLYLISRSEQIKTENSLYRYPEELIKVIKLKGAVKRQINKKRKHE